MNYRHAFHAGNFADVFKHAILVRLLQALARKEQAFVCIETHAGAGRYDLNAPESRRSGEYREGIARLWRGAAQAQDAARTYLAAVRAVNRGERLRYYPGSPRIARFLLRSHDRLRLAEQAPDACERLRAEFGRDAQVTVERADGYGMLQAWLPPPERRGLVLIDPPYERPGEWHRAVDALALAAGRWPQGVYALWYPIKPGAPLDRFRSALRAAGLRKLLLAETTVRPADSPFGLNGSGMAILNPPWRLETDLAADLNGLAGTLRQAPGGGARVAWLVPE